MVKYSFIKIRKIQRNRGEIDKKGMDLNIVDMDTVLKRKEWPHSPSSGAPEDGKSNFTGNNNNMVLLDSIPSPTKGEFGGFGRSSTCSTSSSYSLGTGYFSRDGPIIFTRSPAPSVASGTLSTTSERSIISDSDDVLEDDITNSHGGPAGKTGSLKRLLPSVSSKSMLPSISSKSVLSSVASVSSKAIVPPIRFRWRSTSSSFMRISDLKLDASVHSVVEQNHADMEIHPNFHHPSSDPPPGIEHDPKETWVALDNGEGSHAPIAPYAVEALARSGLASAMHEQMWTPNKHTEKLIRRDAKLAATIWQNDGRPIRVPPRGDPMENDVLVWSGHFDHGLYGSDLPAVRAEGIVNMSPEALVDLLVDSSRVKEYNKMSLGRTDLLILQNDLHNDGPFGRSITKIMRSETKPPLLRKTLQFVSLLHAREMECGEGYVIVSRAVTQPTDSSTVNSDSSSKVLLSEILLGVNVIRRVEGDSNRCVMVNVNHVCSPMVPTMIAKKIGSSAAVGFLNDIRALCP